MAVTWEAGKGNEVYINGKKAVSTKPDYTDTSEVAAAELRIGDKCNMYLDELFIYKRILSEKEVVELYDNSK